MVIFALEPDWVQQFLHTIKSGNDKFINKQGILSLIISLKMIKEKDLIEIEYTGKLKEDNLVFDTTDEKTAKDSRIFDEGREYKPITIRVGEGQIIKGIDKTLAGKELQKEYTIEVEAEEAYGEKDVKLIELVPTSKFLNQNIRPMPGLHVNIDGSIGMIRTVSGGRTLVDFNHPLAGKDLVYSIKINRIVEEDKQAEEDNKQVKEDKPVSEGKRDIKQNRILNKKT